MNMPAKLNSLQTYQLLLYRRALHPELFQLKGRRTIAHAGFEFEAWIMPGAHLLRFQAPGFAACELVTDQNANLPSEGAVTSFMCAGEHEFEYLFDRNRVQYVSSVQTETLTDNLFAATYEDMLQFADETDSLVHRWVDQDGGRCLSLLEVQRMYREVHAHGYHLVAGCGLVLRTQTIFEQR
jgi:hypothetical protein